MLWRRTWNFAVVMLVYACTGATAAFVSGRVSALLGLEKWSALWWLAWIVLIFPLYNVLLLAFAFIFGKYDAFRSRQRMIVAKLKRLVPGREPETSKPETGTKA